MKVTNERKCADTIFDIDMDDREYNILLQYGKDHIDDDALISFAMRDIVCKQVSRAEFGDSADLVAGIMANAAELGCPSDNDVDMWFRSMDRDDQCAIIMKYEKIIDDVSNNSDNVSMEYLDDGIDYNEIGEDDGEKIT